MTHGTNKEDEKNMNNVSLVADIITWNSIRNDAISIHKYKYGRTDNCKEKLFAFLSQIFFRSLSLSFVYCERNWTFFNNLWVSYFVGIGTLCAAGLTYQQWQLLLIEFIEVI